MSSIPSELNLPSDAAKVSRVRRLWAALHGFLWRPMNAVLFGVGAVLLFSLSVILGEELNIRINSTEFCVSCHSMSAYVFEEYKESKHYNNPAGVRAECGDCHVSKRFFHALWDHVVGLEDFVSNFTSDWENPETFEAARSAMAERARLALLKSDSGTCQNCHVMDAIVPAKKRGRKAHLGAIERNDSNCIACHYNLVHKEAPITPAFSAAIKALDTPR